jgi:hypothetical protein
MKAVLIVYPYFFSKEQYYNFNQNYFTASIIIILASFGFNISQSKLPVKKGLLFSLVLINAFFVTLGLLLISGNVKVITFLTLIIYSTIIAFVGILNFRNIFYGNYIKYFLVILSMSTAHFLLIFFTHISNQFAVLSVIVLLWFVFINNYLDNVNTPSKKIKEYYKIGYSALLMNSSVSVILAGDKFLANHFFETGIANSYTFAWMFTAPLFYIGNLIEKFLFTETVINKRKILTKGIILSLILICLYVILTFLLIRFFPAFLPSSVSQNYFTNIYVLMTAGYSIFVLFYFPLNSYIYKFCKTSALKNIGTVFTLVLAAYVLVFLIINGVALKLTYVKLLIITYSFVYILLFVKAVFIFKDQSKNLIIGYK